MEYAFHKLHSLGNDFVLLDLRPDHPPPGATALARLADRRRGVGCDQVLSLYPAAAGGIDVDCRIHNADGSEAEQCGNGMRCVALYLLRHGGHTGATRLTVGVPAGLVELTPLGKDRFRASMGVPALDPDGARGQLRHGGRDLPFTALSLGNPHAVFHAAEAGAVVCAMLRSHSCRLPSSARPCSPTRAFPGASTSACWTRRTRRAPGCGSMSAAPARPGPAGRGPVRRPWRGGIMSG